MAAADGLSDPPPILASLLLLSDEGQGHVRDYNEAVGRAVRLAGWTHRAALVKSWQGTSLPTDWEICLDSPNLKRFWARNLSYGRMARSVAQYLRERLIPTGRPSILFIEDLSTSTLIVLTLALRRVPRERLGLWLLVRYSLADRGWSGRVSRMLLRRLQRALPPGALQLLSDSQPLADALAAYTGQSFTVMPIPHTEIEAAAPPAIAPGDRLVCWWPGSPRPEKGLAIMRALAGQESPDMQRLELVAAAEAGIKAVPGGAQIRVAPPGMDRAAYEATFNASHVILLPYDAAAYRERTSGIFVEAVAAGRLPVTTAGTWMAAELKRYGLDALVIDWNPATVGRRILELAHDADVAQRLANMRADYQERHGEAAYARQLTALYARMPWVQGS